ncbi:MAG: hypothetical protein ACPG4U_10115 [Pseudomonadales bacterium]
MLLCRCPNCHSRIHLEALIQDSAAQELIALVTGMDSHLGRPLVVYLGLFRSASRDLAFDRALKLANEVLQLEPAQALPQALAQTVEAIRNKRQQQPGIKPLSNHNYLKRVLEDVPAQPGDIAQATSRRMSKQEARSGVTAAIMDINDTDW